MYRLFVKLPAAGAVFWCIFRLVKNSNAMTLVLIEVPDEAAALALGQQENVRVVQIVAPGQAQLSLPPSRVEIKAEKPPKRKWAGCIPAASGVAWDKHLQEIRSEWERGI